MNFDINQIAGQLGSSGIPNAIGNAPTTKNQDLNSAMSAVNNIGQIGGAINPIIPMATQMATGFLGAGYNAGMALKNAGVYQGKMPQLNLNFSSTVKQPDINYEGPTVASSIGDIVGGLVGPGAGLKSIPGIVNLVNMNKIKQDFAKKKAAINADVWYNNKMKADLDKDKTFYGNALSAQSNAIGKSMGRAANRGMNSSYFGNSMSFY